MRCVNDSERGRSGERIVPIYSADGVLGITLKIEGQPYYLAESVLQQNVGLPARARRSAVIFSNLRISSIARLRQRITRIGSVCCDL